MLRSALKRWRRFVALAFLCVSGSLPAPVEPPAPQPREIKLEYGIEWRLIRAGTATLVLTPPHEALRNARLNLLATGLVSKLFPVDDRYVANFEGQGCAADVWLQSQEGSRKRETKITLDRGSHRADYLERDLVKNQVVLSSQITIPDCPYDVLGALHALRRMKLDPGQSTQMPVTDGKKLVSARVEAQERETIKTPLGVYKTIRYEAFLFNNVLYQRKGRLFIWVSDDERRLPVQIKVQLQFHIGTLTLQLEKEEQS